MGGIESIFLDVSHELTLGQIGRTGSSILRLCDKDQR
jgi:hypothetical protein